jgi:putative peptide zinc metalloprotease protein
MTLNSARAGLQDLSISPDDTAGFHRLVIRPDDDDAAKIIVGRAEIGEFAGLPAVCGKAIRLLDEGRRIGEVAAAIAVEDRLEVDVAGLVASLIGLSFVREVSGRPVPDQRTEAVRDHFRFLEQRHVQWIFRLPAKLVWAVVCTAGALTVVRHPWVVPERADFFWSHYVGLSILVNVAFFSLATTAHEMMHLIAARSLGVPARISLGTRLHYLVAQTDVTAIWGVPRRHRYRVYLAGLSCDIFLAAAMLLCIVYLPLPALIEGWLRAFVLCLVLGIALQAQVHMRTDLYFVLRDLLRCRNLFDDGLAYARHFFRRVIGTVPGARRPQQADPTAGMAAHERRAIRVYAVFLCLGTACTLAVFGCYGIPIAATALIHAGTALWNGVNGGALSGAIDAGLFLLIEIGIQTLFVVTFVRGHRHWFRPRESAGPPSAERF